MNAVIENTKRIQLNQYTCLPPKNQRNEDDYYSCNSKPKSKKKSSKKEKQSSTIATEMLLTEKLVSAGLPQQPRTVFSQLMAKQQQSSCLLEKRCRSLKKVAPSTKTRSPENVKCENINVNGSVIPPDFVFYSDDEPDKKSSENPEDLTKNCDSRLKDLLACHQEDPNAEIKINEKLLTSKSIADRKKELLDLSHAMRIFENIRARKRENEKLVSKNFVSNNDDHKSPKSVTAETTEGKAKGILKNIAEESPKSPKTVTFHSSVKTEEKPKIQKLNVSRNGCLSHNNCSELEYIDRIFELDIENYKFDDEIRHVPILADENFTFIKRFEYVDPYTAQIYNHNIPSEYLHLDEYMFKSRTVPYSSLNLYSNAPSPSQNDYFDPSVPSQNDYFDQVHW